jgi:hypothetical protein
MFSFCKIFSSPAVFGVRDDLRESYDFDVIKIAGKSFVFMLILGNGKVFMDEWGKVCWDGGWGEVGMDCGKIRKKTRNFVFFDLQI